MSRRVKLLALAVVIAGGVNVAAARLDAHTDDARRATAEHEVREWLAKRRVHASVDCTTGRSCAVTLRDGTVVPVDPLAPELRTD